MRDILAVLPCFMITSDISAIAAILAQGQVAAIPTETVYGLAADATNLDAVHQVYQLKKRPLNHPLIMHVGSDWDITPWVDFIPAYARKFMQAFWPGPLTLVFKIKPNSIHPSVTGHQTTLAIRSPAHPLAQALLDRLGKPLVAPSANPFGKISPTTAQHVRESFAGVDLPILDGGRCKVGIESTILNATNAHAYQILRQGMISLKAIKQLLPEVPQAVLDPIKVSGSLPYHYQPDKPLYAFESSCALMAFYKAHPHAFVLALDDLPIPPDQYSKLSSKPEQLAYELYFELRQADASPCPMLLIQLPQACDDFKGIRDKILKAATKQ